MAVEREELTRRWVSKPAWACTDASQRELHKDSEQSSHHKVVVPDAWQRSHTERASVGTLESTEVSGGTTTGAASVGAGLAVGITTVVSIFVASTVVVTASSNRFRV